MPDKSQQIAALNDAFRETFCNGILVLTSGFQALSGDVQASILYKVRTFDDFSADNDPYEEHDFGAFTYQGIRIVWKIDYYDLRVELHSEDPANPGVTQRVLTIMLAEEY